MTEYGLDKLIHPKEVKRCGCIVDPETRLLRAIFAESPDCVRHRIRWVSEVMLPNGYIVTVRRRRFRDAYAAMKKMPYARIEYVRSVYNQELEKV